MPYKSYAFKTYQDPVADPAYLHAISVALASGKISKERHQFLVDTADRGGQSADTLNYLLAQAVVNETQAKASIAKANEESRRNGARALGQQVWENITNSAGAPEGTKGKWSLASGKHYASAQELGEALASGQDKVVVSKDSPFAALLARARQTGLYKPLFSKNLPGFDPSLLTPSENAEYLKTRKGIHEARTNAENTRDIEFGSVFGGIAYALVTAPTAAQRKQATLKLAEGARVADEIVEAQNAQQTKTGLLDAAQLGVKAAAAAASAGIGAVATGAAAAVAKLGASLAQVGATYGINVAKGNPNAETQAEIGAAGAGANAAAGAIISATR